LILRVMMAGLFSPSHQHDTLETAAVKVGEIALPESL
jgi:hypothetical protein